MNDHSSQPLSLTSDQGKGRAFIILVEDGESDRVPSEVAAIVAQQARALLVRTPRVTDDNWGELTDRLLSTMNSVNVRQASFLTFGASGALVQNLALRELKLVRTIVFVNASTRAHPPLLQRIYDRIERLLPLGLPFRSLLKGFDGKPFLHRIRCPVLVVITPDASLYERAQADLLARGLPTAWKTILTKPGWGSELAEFLIGFQDVPAKCPQKVSVRPLS